MKDLYLKTLVWLWLLMGAFLIGICAAAKIGRLPEMQALLAGCLFIVPVVYAARKKGLFSLVREKRKGLLRSGDRTILARMFFADILVAGVLSMGLFMALTFFVLDYYLFPPLFVKPSLSYLAFMPLLGGLLSAVMWIDDYAGTNGKKRLKYGLWITVVLLYVSVVYVCF